MCIIRRLITLLVAPYFGRVALYRLELGHLVGVGHGSHAALVSFDAGVLRFAWLAAHQAGKAGGESVVVGKHLMTYVRQTY